MERCRSSEPVLGTPFTSDRDRKHDIPSGIRGGRTRDIKATSLLLKSVSSPEQAAPTEKAEWSHHEGAPREVHPTPPAPEIAPAVEVEDERMDIDGEEGDEELASASALLHDQQEPVVWGMPKWGREPERKEVRKGVRLVGAEEVSIYLQNESQCWARSKSEDGGLLTDNSAPWAA